MLTIISILLMREYLRDPMFVKELLTLPKKELKNRLKKKYPILETSFILN